MSIGFWQIAIVVVLVVLLFGRGKISSLMGDVPKGTGVCTDVIIRVYRLMGIDLQQEIHEDILKNQEDYPNINRADHNIDHRLLDVDFSDQEY